MMGRGLSFAMALVLFTLVGCGTNKFQQELQVEEAAIKLHNETEQGAYELVSTDDLKELLDAEEIMVLLDAMPAVDSFDKGHIQGAVNFLFPKDVMSEWNSDNMGEMTKQDYEKVLGSNKNKLIVVYCGFVKCARSHNAAIFAKELGYTNVKRYPGGIHAWRGAGNSLTKD